MAQTQPIEARENRPIQEQRHFYPSEAPMTTAAPVVNIAPVTHITHVAPVPHYQTDDDSIGNRASTGTDTAVAPTDRKPRHHLNQRRRKRYGHNRQRRHPQSGEQTNRHAVEGEDNYTVKKEE